MAYEAGLKNRDYIYEVNGTSVLGMDHDECTKLIKNAGDSIDLKIERYVDISSANISFANLNFKTKSFLSCYDIFFYFLIRGDFIVPNMDEAFPKKKVDKADEKDSSVGFVKDNTKRSPKFFNKII